MGAKFTPSIANLFMGEWEDKIIFSTKKEELRLYKRYIDDLFFIWAGSKLSLQGFLDELNANVKTSGLLVSLVKMRYISWMSMYIGVKINYEQNFTSSAPIATVIFLYKAFITLCG